MITNLTIWKQRGLTIIGKVAKSMGMSNLICSISCLECPEAELQEAQRQLNRSIWADKPNKIQHNTMIGPYEMGGIRAPDVFLMKKSLRLA